MPTSPDGPPGTNFNMEIQKNSLKMIHLKKSSAGAHGNLVAHTPMRWTSQRWSPATVWTCSSLQWRHNERDGVSNHQPHDCWRNLLSMRRSKKTSELRCCCCCSAYAQIVRVAHSWVRSSCCLDGFFIRFSTLIISSFRVTGLSCGGFTGGQWIARTKGQWRGKMFPFHDVIMCSRIQITNKNRTPRIFVEWRPWRNTFKHSNTFGAAPTTSSFSI